jgi:hypothetical protein
MATNVSASLSPINPNTLFSEGYELADQSIIPNENITAAFVPFEDKVEYWVYDFNKNLVGGEYNFTGYNLAQNPSSNDENDTTTVELSPINDLLNFGFDTGQLYTVYNFVRYQLSSTPDNRYYIAEISSDRTELRLKSNIISNQDVFSSFQQLKSELNSSEYFDEFYITFGDNEYNIGVNIELDTTGEIYSVLVKLYDALPPNFGLKDEAYVVTKVAESVGYQIEYPDLIEIPTNVTLIQGPNTNIEFKDFVNNSTELKSKTELTATNSSTSGDNLANILNRKGVTITPNYSYDTFNEFVNFSSAKKRIENFVEKVRQIQVYEADIATLSTITGPTSQSTEVTTNIASAYTNIETLVKNFDGYEYFLYYNTGSSSYPKSTSTFPYTLYPTTDTTVLEWLGSDVEGSQYYGGILLSASLYDSNNQNWLYYTIPEFIRENSDNDQYLEFSNMVGQHFDEIWLYTKAVSEKLNTTSDVDSGVPLQLADDVITSLGYKGFSNNYNNQNNFIGLTGENSGSYVPPTGSELITDYIAVNNGEELFQYGNFINQHISSSFPYAIDKVSKEIYKRLYHNMAYLTKKKGTISGLRQLINIWGIPNTILRINEFGGKNKDNSDDYDLWYNRYNYTFKPLNSEGGFAQAKMPWFPLQKNFITEGEIIVPDCIQFRFKTNGAPGTSYTSSLLAKTSNETISNTDFDFGIQLAYSPPTTGSYSGAGSSEYENWGTMRLVMSGSAADGGDAISDPIYLPFFDRGWWSVMLQRDTHVSASDNSNATTYTLYAKNNIYNGWDGNQIGFEGSASIVSNISTSINEAWNKTYNTNYIYLGAASRVEVGSTLIQQNANFPFSGSYQEFRYYSAQLPETVFNDYVMNPESIEGINITGPSSSFNLLNFRAALGNELESTFISPALGGGQSSYTSIHPAIVGSPGGIYTTESFKLIATTNSLYTIEYPSASAILPYSTTNTEVYFLDQPAAGVRNRISNKIKIDDGQDYGTTLSSLRSIQQNYQISRSYTEDINSLEVAFSPQDEVNDDIIQTFGFGVISDVLADPRFLSSSDDYYPGLRSIAKEYFEKYSQGNIYDYLRLIKYFDNSIFKAIKNYVPARTSVSTGIVIKQHLLERNRRRPVQLSEVTKIAVTPSGGFNTPIVRENLELTSSIEIGSFSGGTGGVLEDFNNDNLNYEVGFLSQTLNLSSNITTNTITGPVDGTYTNIEGNFPSPPSEPFFTIIVSGGVITSIILTGLNFPTTQWVGDEVMRVEGTDFNQGGGYIIITLTESDITYQNLQVCSGVNETVLGDVPYVDYTQVEFYNGELCGSTITATTQSLLNDPSFDALLNNVSGSRLNSYLMKVEYDNGLVTASNLPQILDRTAQRAAVPDSNYTSKRSILPRYEGSKASSANYNHYTSASSGAEFRDGSTGSWNGDSSYGKTAAIDKNPIYFGHFQKSFNNFSIFNTTDYLIDQLIEVPFEDIKGQNIEPKVIKIEGDNSKLQDVVSTFEKNRKLSAVYESEIFEDVNYSLNSLNKLSIRNPGSKYITTATNQTDEGQIPSGSAYIFRRFPQEPIGFFANTNQVFPRPYDGSINMITGSGTLTLKGSSPGFGDIAAFLLFTNQIESERQGDTEILDFYFNGLKGPGLSIFHHYNFCLKNNIFNFSDVSSTPSSLYYGISEGIDNSNPNNYLRFSPSSSRLPQYEDVNEPFLIERGDEIRVTYTSPILFVGSNTVTQDFTVLDVGFTDYPSGSADNIYTVWNNLNSQFTGSAKIEGELAVRLYNKISVYPDPSTLAIPIPNGSVFQYTHRKRKNADNVVNAISSPLEGSNGAATYSGGGYIIPNDLTVTQKRNVQTLITQLKSKNSFTNDDTV